MSRYELGDIPLLKEAYRWAAVVCIKPFDLESKPITATLPCCRLLSGCSTTILLFSRSISSLYCLCLVLC